MKKILTFIILCSLILSFSTVAYADWEDSTTTQLVWGINRRDVTRYTSAGVQKAKVLEVDLSNPRLKVKLLTDSDGSSYLSTVKNLASQDERVLAAINGDFFAWYSKDKTRGTAVGLNVSEGEMITSPPTEEELASLVFTTNGAVLTQYFKPNMTVTTPSGRIEKINTVNKFDSLMNLAMYNSFWGKTFTCNGGGEQVAVVVEDKVTEIITQESLVEIPENGYLLAGLSDFTDFFDTAIKVGDTLKTELYFDPYFGDIETAIGGGTVLVKNGAKAPITHMRYGRDSRSAAGISRDGKTLYLITADKGNGSIGMSLDELTRFMLNIGVYDGINLDGGGSTQLVARAYGESGISYINSLENGYARPVANALGIVLTGGEPGILDGITVKTDKAEINVGEAITASFIPYDQLYYPLSFDADIKVEYTFEGVPGSQNGNTFIPSDSGTLTCIVNYGGFQAYSMVTVHDPDRYVDADRPLYSVNVGETVPVVINAITKGGEQRIVPLSDVAVNIPGGIATFDGSVITAKKAGFGTINFSYGKFCFSAYLSVGGVLPDDSLAEPTSYSDDFETDNASALSYPSQTPSAYKLSNEEVKSGKYSGKLWFDFDNEITDLQSAYAVFNSPAILNRSGGVLTLDVYSPGFESTQLKAMITDSTGNVRRISIENDLSFTGWKTVSVALPSDISLPAKLSRLYVVEGKAESKQRGAVYFDNLSLIAGGAGDYDKDEFKEESFTPSFTITGGINATETLLAPIAALKVKESIEKAPVSYSFDAFTKAENTLRKESGKTVTSGNVTLIQYKDLSTLEEAVKTSEQTVAVIVSELNSTLKYNLQQALSNDKNVFVISGGENLNVEILGGVRFITLPALTPSILTNQKSFVTVDIGTKKGKTVYRINRIKLWE